METGTTTILTNLICQYAEKTVVEEMSEKLARPTRQHSPVVEQLQSLKSSTHLRTSPGDAHDK